MPLLRYHALVALRKSLTSAKRAVSEVAFKDLLKQMKNGLSDKCLSIERAAAQVIHPFLFSRRPSQVMSTRS